MAFFEDLKKTLSDAGQGVAQQTRIFTEVTRLTGVITEKEQRIERIYTEIGKHYYEAHKDDPAAAEETALIEEITGLFAEIEAHKEEINTVKGIKKCPQCGAEVSLDTAFCSQCGTKLPMPEPKPEPAPEVPEGFKVCPSCGNMVAQENKFCDRCGTKFEDVQPAPENLDSNHPQE